MKYYTIICFFLMPCLTFGQGLDTLAKHYKIYDTRAQKIVPLNNIVAAMTKTDVLFFGEEHNDPTGHQLELILLSRLNDKYPDNLVLSMEMFEADCQDVLNEYLRDLIREKNFRTDARVWPNYNDYSPIVEFAKSNMIPVIAANSPERYVNMVNRLGLSSLNNLDATGKSYIPPLPIDTLTGAYLVKFDTIMGGHSSMPGMQMYQAQNLWDATMGWSIAKYLKNNPGSKIMQINGGFHSEEKLGAAAQLLHYSNQARILNIAVYSDDSFANPDWGKFSKMGDYIILTDPKLPRTF
jgi:uncharacterized iron-regulated protein